MHAREYSNLTVVSLDPEQHKQTCGYWYTVTSGAMAHTAFATREGLDSWMSERNLALHTELPEKGEWGSSLILGSYRDCMHLDVDAFNAVRPVIATTVMSNGDYTLGLIEESSDGVRTVHYLNPNVKTRLVFDWPGAGETLHGTRKVMS